MVNESTRCTIGDTAVGVLCPLIGSMAVLNYVRVPEPSSASMFMMAVFSAGFACLCLRTVPRLWKLWRCGTLARRRVGLVALPYPFFVLGMMRLVTNHGWQVFPASPMLSAAVWFSWGGLIVAVPFVIVAIAEQSDAMDSR